MTDSSEHTRHHNNQNGRDPGKPESPPESDDIAHEKFTRLSKLTAAILFHIAGIVHNVQKGTIPIDDAIGSLQSLESCIRDLTKKTSWE